MGFLSPFLEQLLNLREYAEETVKALARQKEADAEAKLAELKQNVLDETVGQLREQITDPVLAGVVCGVIEQELGAGFDKAVDIAVAAAWEVVEAINPKDKPSPPPDLTPGNDYEQ